MLVNRGFILTTSWLEGKLSSTSLKSALRVSTSQCPFSKERPAPPITQAIAISCHLIPAVQRSGSNKPPARHSLLFPMSSSSTHIPAPVQSYCHQEVPSPNHPVLPSPPISLTCVATITITRVPSQHSVASVHGLSEAHPSSQCVFWHSSAARVLSGGHGSTTDLFM